MLALQNKDAGDSISVGNAAVVRTPRGKDRDISVFNPAAEPFVVFNGHDLGGFAVLVQELAVSFRKPNS